MQEPIAAESQPAGQSAAHIVQVLMQFALAVRYRKNVMLSAFLVTGLLGGLYYATATRYYAANASLLVIQTGNDIMEPGTALQTGKQQGLMPTYEKLITMPRVLEGALRYLRPEDRVDMAGVARNQWPKVLQRNLSADTDHFTNIIEIEYLSKDAGAAVSVVNAVVQSYLDFMEETHKGTAGKFIEVLEKEKAELAERLHTKELALRQARLEVGALSSGLDSELLHPMTQRVVSFGEALVETQKQRVEMEATLAAVESAIRNGEGLEQHIMSVADMVGREILLNSLGINGQHAAAQAALERDLIGYRAEMEAMQEHYGPRHPQVAVLEERIRQTQQYLISYPERSKKRFAEIRETQLGPLLSEMMRQKLNETWQRELRQQAQYEEAYAEASRLGGQLSQIEIIEHEVQRLRDWDDLLLNRIASVDIKQEGPEVRVEVVNEPTKAGTPASPNAYRVVLLVMIAGLAAGLMGVYVLDILDDRFRSLEELQRQLGTSVLAMIRRLELSEEPGVESLQVYRRPDAADSEPFRTLRTALSLGNEASSRVVISSAEPGDGKTTVLANLAVAYAQSRKRTLLIDADLRRPGLTSMLELRGRDGLSCVVGGHGDTVRTAAWCIQPSGVEGLDVLPSGPRPTNPAELLASSRFAELLAWAETVYEHVLIDSPPALATSDAAVIGRLVDGVILVVQPDKNRRRTVLRAAESFGTLGIRLLGVVINRVDVDRDGDYYGYGGNYVYQASYGDDDPSDDQPRNHREAATAGGIVPRRAARPVVQRAEDR